VPALLAPRYWANHLLLVVLLVAAGWLGLWQYHGWQDRREAEARDLTQVAPIPLVDAIGPDDPFPGALVGQPVEVQGIWVPDSTIFVAGREHDDERGYWVVTGLETDEGSVLPVVRGWSAEAADPGAPNGPAELVGWLQPPEGTGAVDDDPTDDVLPQLRVADLAQRFDEDLYGAYVVVRPGADAGTHAGTEGLVPADLQQLPDAGRLTALRNLLYAIEWWFFGAFAVFVWWRWVRETAAEPPVAAASQEPAPDSEQPRTG
jgi:cytochrome oxidase assembly protein ShyY1